jgi:glyoxylase-like metal-dependent hydrolase (beta-lactamase superfamily II)
LPAPLHDKIKAAIAAISNLPVKYLINTHYHDHTGGNEAFAREGVTIVAQDNVKVRLAAGTTDGLTGVKTPPAAPAALPSDTYTNFSKIRMGGRVADLKRVPNAHTDGDTYVWFKTARVLATGGTFTNGRYPDIDFANGGNIKGMIAAADIYLKLTNARTRIVPGHGPVADKAALREYRTMLVTARDRMAKLVREGKTEDQVRPRHRRSRCQISADGARGQQFRPRRLPLASDRPRNLRSSEFPKELISDERPCPDRRTDCRPTDRTVRPSRSRSDRRLISRRCSQVPGASLISAAPWFIPAMRGGC